MIVRAGISQSLSRRDHVYLSLAYNVSLLRDEPGIISLKLLSLFYTIEANGNKILNIIRFLQQAGWIKMLSGEIVQLQDVRGFSEANLFGEDAIRLRKDAAHIIVRCLDANEPINVMELVDSGDRAPRKDNSSPYKEMGLSTRHRNLRPVLR